LSLYDKGPRVEVEDERALRKHNIDRDLSLPDIIAPLR
jgi:hypothetical protein